MFEGFPYTNFHELNLDWIIKIAKDFLDQYTNIQETISTGLTELDEKAENLKEMLQTDYNNYNDSLASSLAQALTDIRATLAQSITQIHNDSTLYVQSLLDSIPADFSDLVNAVNQIDIKSFVNLYNPYAEGIVTGGYYNYIGGFSNNPAYMSTDFIPVTVGHHYMLSNFQPNQNPQIQVAFYNASKTFVSGINSEPNTYIEIPTGVAYMRIPLLLVNRYETTIVEGDIIPPYNLPFNDKAINITNIKPYVKIVKNLYNSDDPDNRYGGYLNYLNVWGDHPEWMETGFLPVEPGEKYCASDWMRSTFQLSVCLYDYAKNFVTGLNIVQNGMLTIPNNIRYVRIPVPTSQRYTFSFGKATYPPPAGLDYNKETLIIDDIVMNGENLTDKIEDIENAISTQTNYIGIQWSEKTWYCYGTSISNTAGEGRYPQYLQAMSNMNHVNKAISGGGIGDLGAYSNGQVYNAICNTTDGKQNADIITLETGANDVDVNVPLGTVYDEGRSTLAGCLNDCIRYLQANTDAQIVIIPSPADANLIGSAFEKYCEWVRMIKEICMINNVHFIENNDNIGYGKFNSDKRSLYVVDNIHPTQLGGYVMAENIWYALRNIPTFHATLP